MKRRRLLRRLLKALAVFAGVLVLAIAVAWSVSADVRYLTRGAVEGGRILLSRRPIAEVAADPATDPATRGKLLLVLAARAFAADSLGLSVGGSYRTYAHVRRDTLVLVLSASRADRLQAHTWNYPIVGRVPYKGFFSFDHAAEEARKLERAGMDTYLRVANAFATLGWFEDPLLSTVLREDSADLAATVIHESFHNTLFVPGQAAFNESLANFIGHRGAEAFFRSRGDTANASRSAARWRDEVRLGRFESGLVTYLERLYSSSAAPAAIREARLLAFRQAAIQLAAGLGGLETVDGARLAARPLNNAVLLARRLYRTRLEEFDGLLAARGGDLRSVVADLRSRVAAADDPWGVLGPAP